MKPFPYRILSQIFRRKSVLNAKNEKKTTTKHTHTHTHTHTHKHTHTMEKGRKKEKMEELINDIAIHCVEEQETQKTNQ